MSRYASIATKRAYLSEDFGAEMATRYFGDEQMAELPKYVRGAKKGKLKGYIQWDKVTRGGWVRQHGYMGESDGYVENRVGRVIKAEIYLSQWSEDDTLVATKIIS
jgi:hypothetical protein